MSYKSIRSEPTQSVYVKALDHELLSEAEELQLLRDAQAGDENAREKLILCNIKLVHSVVKQYENLNRGVSVDDLMADGVMGLCKAISKYDEKFGTRLSTYAVLWIHQTTARSRFLEGIIHLPEYLKRKVQAINKAEAGLLGEGRDISVEAISQMTGIEKETVERLKHLESDVGHVMSLDAPIDDESTTELMDVIADEQAETAYEQVEMEVSLEFFLSKLNVRERFVVERSYGIPISMTNKEIAKVIGCNHNEITNIREQALAKLKRLGRALRGTPEQIKQAIENPLLVMTGEYETIPLFDPQHMHIQKTSVSRKKKAIKNENSGQIPLF